MIKLSFIAPLLAAIGYKEYNPSIIGNWSDGRDKTSWIEYTRDSVIVHHPDLQQPDSNQPADSKVQGVYNKLRR